LPYFHLADRAKAVWPMAALLYEVEKGKYHPDQNCSEGQQDKKRHWSVSLIHLL
jgi:hypothetical protein